MAKIAGKYEYQNDDGNFEQYLRATGLSEEHIEIGKQLRPTLEFSKSGDEYTMKITSEVINKDVKFKLNEEVNEKTPSGKNIKATYTLNGDRLVQKQTLESGFTATIDHEFRDDGLTLTYTWNGGKAVRHYKRV
ncbi:fatty acid-binding protein-like [Paramacrobiotus metropolitanus]|uniref:fatty acid-binding protein-like n=1 Tax=Paramacrobiotus metropolitanus TaxID=2943436 RepID=UPI0024459E82|nr:fatty acid-binding protein-like [Paramacrobiotus metropolitanus]